MLQNMIIDCMSKLKVMDCSASMQVFLYGLKAMDGILANNAKIKLVVVDSVNQFWYKDEFLTNDKLDKFKQQIIKHNNRFYIINYIIMQIIYEF